VQIFSCYCKIFRGLASSGRSVENFHTAIDNAHIGRCVVKQAISQNF